MSTARVLSALNFLTGEGVNYYHEGCDGSAIEALITDYFNESPSDDDDSSEECNRRNEGNYLNQKYSNFRYTRDNYMQWEHE